MHINEKLDKCLEEGEVIQWSGAPQPYKLFDETHKTLTLISLSWALAWGIILIGGYCALSVSKGQEIKTGVMVICAAVPLMLAWGPIIDRNKVKKLLYAVTNKNAIIVSEEDDKSRTMYIGDIDGLRVDKTNNGNCHIRVGSSVFKASVRKLPSLAFLGEFDTIDNDKIYKGLVFYNVSAEDGKAICDLLKPPVKADQ